MSSVTHGAVNAMGIEPGSYARVVSTNLQENLLTVEAKTGEVVTYDPKKA